jgi:putative hydrolase of the HAD superfamily
LGGHNLILSSIEYSTVIVKAITFDLGGTLLESEMDLEGYHKALASYLQTKGCEVEPQRLKSAIDTALAHLSEIQKEGREKTFEEVYREALERVQLKANSTTLREIRELFKAHHSATIYPCVDQLLSDLSKKYKLGLISNSIHSIPIEIVADRNWGKHFSAVVVSRDVGFRKPRAEIFRRALSLLNVGAAETIHVGDRVDADVEGALAVGMTPILIGKGRETTWRGLVIGNICELPSLLDEITGKGV